MPQIYKELGRIVADEQKRRQRFYDTLQEAQKTEFINGEVIVHSPVKLRHNLASKHLLMLLDMYVRKRGLGLVGHEKILIALTRNDYEPDVCFFSAEKARNFQPDQMIFPAPDFAAEVLSPSTEAIDRGVKLEDYAAHGVDEYWIVDPEHERIEQYLLAGETYELVFKADSGVVRSRAVDGFAPTVRSIFDEAENLAALGQIMAG
ncbi:MAG: Uma2 family endonuclease [Caldilineaceae bacterium]|nr:Uma2 family endonuclease [Caldilineaceae bacterium]